MDDIGYILQETDSEDGRGGKIVAIAFSLQDAQNWKNGIIETSYHFRDFYEIRIFKSKMKDY